MKNNFNVIFSDRVVLYALILSFLFFLCQIALIGFQYLKLPPVIPLFNSLSWGNERLASTYVIFLVPVVLLIIGVCNFSFAQRFYKKHALLSRMLSYNLLLCTILSVIALIQILFLVL